MEALYAKLYDKYSRLKKKKLTEMDEINKDQEVKFLGFVSAAEELVQHLRSENENLQEIVDNLRSEVASVRSAMDKECAEYQNRLMEESQKNKALNEELVRLKEACNLKDRSDGIMHLNPLESARVVTRSVSGTTRKRCRESEAEAAEGSILPSTANEDNNLPECCKRAFPGSGGGAKESGATTCMFQTLSEYLLGVKLSTNNQTEGACIMALHQSSGYSFSLTWVDNSVGEEANLLYNVLSLGTFERVAPEWMKDVIMFSTSMCPIFFERVARVIKLQS